MKIARREFLERALAASALVSFGGVVPAVFRRAAAASRPEPGGTVFVAIQLTGGNDGLNTVVPFEDDAYARNRRTLRLGGREVRRIAPGLGFHPEMEALWKAYQEGLVAVVQGVGYPRSSRDHDTALRDWHTAAPGDPACETGWLGRAIDELKIAADVPGAFVGWIPRPGALDAKRAVVPALRDASEWSLPDPGLANARAISAAGGLERGERGDGSPSREELLDFVRERIEAARASARRVEEVLHDRAREAPYPELPLAGELRSVARLIRADLGIRIFVVELGGGGIGGFDTHANQGENHGALLRQLSQSVAAFLADLKRDGLLERVLVMTYSEFGRTVLENGRRGTDHGAAAPVLLAGGKLRGGLFGAHPSLLDLEEGGLRHGIDFRQLYATILGPWLGLDARGILGAEYEPLDLFART